MIWTDVIKKLDEIGGIGGEGGMGIIMTMEIIEEGLNVGTMKNVICHWFTRRSLGICRRNVGGSFDFKQIVQVVVHCYKKNFV